MDQQGRAVTPVIATILMVAIVVILAAVIGTFALGFTENFSEPAPNVAQTTGEFVPGADEQVVRITHVAGDSVPVEEIEIIVRASGPGDDLPLEARLVDLPSDDFFSSAIGESNIEGDEELIDEGNSGELNRVIDREGTNVWSAGKTIQFAINSGGADFRDPPELENDDGEANELEVLIMHTPSNSILSEHTFTP
jgi:flagellin-like protein